MEKFIKLRCYVKQIDNQWVAMCIDLSLAAQDEDAQVAIAKLHSQIESYMSDIIDGEERENFHDLFPRKSPLKFRIEYQFARFISKAFHLFRPDNSKRFYVEPFNSAAV